MTTTIMAAQATGSGLAPEQLTAAIRREHEAVSTAARTALGHALEAGRLLAEAKAAIPHGRWADYVRAACDIAPRTASLYLRLHRHRDRLPNRQHVAELSVRQAARLLGSPRAKPEAVAVAPVVDADAGELRLRMPEWYRPGHRHFGSHPSGWFFEVWPHPAGDAWAHFYVGSPPSGHPGDGEGGTLVGPKRGIRVDAIEWSMGTCSGTTPASTALSSFTACRALCIDAPALAATWPTDERARSCLWSRDLVRTVSCEPVLFAPRPAGFLLGFPGLAWPAFFRSAASFRMQAVNGMPTLADDGWSIGSSASDPHDDTDPIASRFEHFNTMLFAGEGDYRRRGMGITPKRKQGAPA